MGNISATFYASFEFGDGYGTSNMHWVKHLERNGVHIDPYFTIADVERYWIEGEYEETNILNRQAKINRIGIIETPPEFFDGNVSPIKIGMSMVETDAMDSYWVSQCNKMDYLVVPSDFQKEVFKRCGVTKPVIKIPFGTEFEHFPYFKRPEKKIFTFGSVGFYMPESDDKDRKGFWLMIQAFLSEFAPDEPVRLLLKSSSPQSEYYINWKDPRIQVVPKVMTRNGLNKTYQDMDCFIFPTRGEGVGQPPREAMATGLPVIATNWSSLTDIMKPEFSYPLNDFKLEKRTDFGRQPGNWAIPSVRELMKNMRYVYEHQIEGRQKGYDSSQWIRKNFSWDTSAKLMKELLWKI